MIKRLFLLFLHKNVIHGESNFPQNIPVKKNSWRWFLNDFFREVPASDENNPLAYSAALSKDRNNQSKDSKTMKLRVDQIFEIHLSNNVFFSMWRNKYICGWGGVM